VTGLWQQETGSPAKGRELPIRETPRTADLINPQDSAGTAKRGAIRGPANCDSALPRQALH